MTRNFKDKIINLLIILSLLLLGLLASSCSGNHETKLKELDQIYGYCGNPQRNIRGKEYERCKMREAAIGPGGKGIEKEPLTISELIGKMQGSNNNGYVSSLPVNKYLWQGALEVTSSYSLDIVDSQGGLIQTDWIEGSSKNNQRCKIKILITSNELVSTGVKSNLICEDFIENNWINSKNDYLEDETKLTIKILENASQKKQEEITN